MTPASPAHAPPCLVVGEALVDVLPHADGTWSERVGGSPANVAVGLARLDHPTTLLTTFGHDRRGDLVRTHLAAAGVQVLCEDGPTSSAVATIDEQGAATYDLDLRWELAERAIPPAVRLLHVGSVSAVLEPGASAVRRMAATAGRHATVSYDVNARPTLTGDSEEARAAVRSMSALADVVKASDEDLAWLDPERSVGETAASLLAPPTRCLAIVVTRGAEGATVVGPDRHLDVAAPRVPVIDTIGAGDSFMAGLLGALRDHDLIGADRREALAALGPDAWTEVIAHAARCAAVTVGRPGADPPTTRDLAGWFGGMPGGSRPT